MSKSASCVDWFVLRQCVDLWVEAVSLRLLEDKILCGNHVVACQVGDRVFVAGVRSFIFRNPGGTRHVCCCSENSCQFGESAVFDGTLYCLFGGSLKS